MTQVSGCQALSSSLDSLSHYPVRKVDVRNVLGSYQKFRTHHDHVGHLHLFTLKTDLIVLGVVGITCPAASISGASLRKIPPSGSSRSRSRNQITELSSYSTTNTSRHAFPNRRSESMHEWMNERYVLIDIDVLSNVTRDQQCLSTTFIYWNVKTRKRYEM